MKIVSFHVQNLSLPAFEGLSKEIEFVVSEWKETPRTRVSSEGLARSTHQGVCKVVMQ